MPNIGQQLLSVPFGDMVRSLGFAIADAQMALDQNSTKIAHMMSGVDPDSRVFFAGREYSLIELGFTPTFYQFVDTIIEVKMAITMTTSRISTNSRTRTSSDTTKRDLTEKSKHKVRSFFFSADITTSKKVGERTVANTSTVDATYSNKYDYTVEGSSLIRTKLVPVPPPAVLEERIRAVMVAEAEARTMKEEQEVIEETTPALLRAVEGFSVAPSGIKAVIDTRATLANLVVLDNPDLRERVDAYPILLSQTEVADKLNEKFDDYKTALKDLLKAKIEAFPDEADASIISKTDLRRKVLEQNPDLAEKINPFSFFLDEKIEEALKAKFDTINEANQAT